MKVLKLFIAHYLWFMSRIIQYGMCSPSFVKSLEIQDLLCTTEANINFGQSRSIIQCSQQCYNNAECQSFFYKLSRLCLGSASVVTDPLPCVAELGTKYYYTTAVPVTTTALETAIPLFPTTTISISTAVPTPNGLPTTPPMTELPTGSPISYGFPCVANTDCLQPNTFCLNFFCKCKPGFSLNPSTLACTNGCTVYGKSYLVYWYKALSDPNGMLYNNLPIVQCQKTCENQNCRSFSYNFLVSQCTISQETALTLPTAYVSNSQTDYYNRNCA